MVFLILRMVGFLLLMGLLLVMSLGPKVFPVNGSPDGGFIQGDDGFFDKNFLIRTRVGSNVCPQKIAFLVKLESHLIGFHALSCPPAGGSVAF